MLYPLLDILFFAFHTSLIAFVLTGWIWRRTRQAHLGLVLAVGASWFGLGIWYGWGYCPCTEWHWQVRRALGDTDLPVSYIKFLADDLLGTDLNAALVDGITLVTFLGAIVLSVMLNVHDRRRRQAAASGVES
jgi:hypothetical protein